MDEKQWASYTVTGNGGAMENTYSGTDRLRPGISAELSHLKGDSLLHIVEGHPPSFAVAGVGVFIRAYCGRLAQVGPRRNYLPEKTERGRSRE